MAASTNAVLTVAVPNTGVAFVVEAVTASDGSGNLTTLFTAGTNGSRLDSVDVHNAQALAAASSNMVVRVFVTDVNGANPTLLDEQAMVAATRSTTVAGSAIKFVFAGGLLLKSGQIVKVCQSVYAGVQDKNGFVGRGGDF